LNCSGRIVAPAEILRKKMRLVVAISLLVAVCDSSPVPEYVDGQTTLREVDTQIVGGQKAKAGQFPWQISLKRSGSYGWSHSCGGSILDKNTIVTAAHCVSGMAASGLQVYYGTLKHASGGTAVAVKTVRGHTGYSSSTLKNDIAILKLASDINLSSGNANIGTVGLPAKNSDPASGTTVTVSGWGTTSEGGSIPADLNYVSVPIVARTTCNTNYGSGSIDNGMICAADANGGKDSCQGDSGGPLVTVSGSTGTLVGVVSWGSGCARKGKPGVYTRVGYFTDWIASNRG